MVTPGAPGATVAPSSTKPVGSAVNISPSTEKTDRVGRDMVLDPMTRVPEKPRLTIISETVIAWPGEIKVLAIAKPVGLAVNV